jgi:hypothetical protein
MKSSTIKRARHAARTGEMEIAHTILVGKPEGTRQLEDLRVGG